MPVVVDGGADHWYVDVKTGRRRNARHDRLFDGAFAELNRCTRARFSTPAKRADATRVAIRALEAAAAEARPSLRPSHKRAAGSRTPIGLSCWDSIF